MPPDLKPQWEDRIYRMNRIKLRRSIYHFILSILFILSNPPRTEIVDPHTKGSDRFTFPQWAAILRLAASSLRLCF